MAITTNDWHEVTLLLPGDTRLPLVHGKWARRRGQIVARYTREELAWALGCVGVVDGTTGVQEGR